MHTRKVFLLFHRWTGLSALAFLFLSGLTGTAIAFHREVDAWLNPDWFYVQPRHSTASVDSAVRAAEAALPGFWVYHPDLPDEAGETLKLYIKPRGDAPASLKKMSPQAFVDPHDGRLLGWRDTRAVSLDRRHLMRFLHDLHANLHLGDLGTLLLGLVAALWLFDHIWGVWLAFPSPRRWRQSFKIKRNAGSLKSTYDVHRAGALWLWPVLAMLAFSGVAMNLDAPVEAAIKTVSPLPPRFHNAAPNRSITPMVGFDAAIAAGSRFGKVDKLRLLPEKGLYLVHVYVEGDRGKHGETDVVVDGADGRVLDVHRPAESTAGEALLAWQLPLHSGYALGLVGRFLIAVAGLVVTMLTVTGFLLWVRRRSHKAGSRRRTSKAREAQPPVEPQSLSKCP